MNKSIKQRGLVRRVLCYSAYGYSSQGTAASLGFNGEWKDSFLEFYALGNGHRFYSPALMRFLSPDAFSPFGKGGVNAFAYCLGDPINRLDPSANASVLWSRAFQAVTRARRVVKALQSEVGRKSIERLPDEMIEEVVNYLPLKELYAFSRTSKRMYEQVWQGAPQQHLRLKGWLEKQPSDLDRLLEVKKIAAGNGQIPAKALLGGEKIEQGLVQALTNIGQSEAQDEAATIRWNRAHQQMMEPLNLLLCTIRIE